MFDVTNVHVFYFLILSLDNFVHMYTLLFTVHQKPSTDFLFMNICLEPSRCLYVRSRYLFRSLLFLIGSLVTRIQLEPQTNHVGYREPLSVTNIGFDDILFNFLLLIIQLSQLQKAYRLVQLIQIASLLLMWTQLCDFGRFQSL